MRRFYILMLIVATSATPPATAAVTAEENMSREHKLVDFGVDDGAEWSVVNDGVMGGLSQSAMRRTEEGTGLFTGRLSLENNGGFASVRTMVGPTDLSSFGSLELKVRGDGRTYQLRLREDGRLDGVAYRAFFATTDGEWTTVRLPFADFLPTWRGRTLNDVRSLDTTRITQLSLMLADKQAGSFALEVEFVRPWSEQKGGS